jgi:OmpA-OmpF porin, OOP family
VRVGRALAILALIATAGCARSRVVQAPAPAPPPRDEMVVLLPGPDGTAGALSVTHAGQQQTLDAPYAAARVSRPGQLEDAGRLTPAQVQQTFGSALAAQPPRPVTFLLYFLENSDEFTPESKLEIPKIL